jgi:hypothetical protein
MILVLGVWTFLRALLGRSTAVTLENIALRHHCPASRDHLSRGAGPCRAAGNASPRRPLPFRPRQAISTHRQARPGYRAPRHCHDHVPRDEHAVLAGAGGDGDGSVTPSTVGRGSNAAREAGQRFVVCSIGRVAAHREGRQRRDLRRAERKPTQLRQISGVDAGSARPRPRPIEGRRGCRSRRARCRRAAGARSRRSVPRSSAACHRVQCPPAPTSTS